METNGTYCLWGLSLRSVAENRDLLCMFFHHSVPLHQKSECCELMDAIILIIPFYNYE